MAYGMREETAWLEDKTGFDPRELPKKYVGKFSRGDHAWLAKGQFNLETLKFEAEDMEASSMFMCDELVHAIQETSEGCWLMTTWPVTILVFKKWACVHEIEDSDPGNLNKYWLGPLPVFNQ